MFKKFVNKLIDGFVYHIVGILLKLFGKLIVKTCAKYNFDFILKIFYNQGYVVHPIGFQYE